MQPGILHGEQPPRRIARWQRHCGWRWRAPRAAERRWEAGLQCADIAQVPRGKLPEVGGILLWLTVPGANGNGRCRPIAGGQAPRRCELWPRHAATSPALPLLDAQATDACKLQLAAAGHVWALGARVARRTAGVLAMHTPCPTGLHAGWAVACMAGLSATVPTLQAAATGLATGDRPNVTTLVAHLTMAAEAGTADQLEAQWMLTQVAACRTSVTTLHNCAARP
mmetsp:Transcript_52114/g.166944  ORF Transcript_52114/g.166944 Transcript_52114/m.166944 type:complete len:225 (-) Transcript_52114:1385-2059(-)